MSSGETFRGLRSPCDLMALASVTPPSPAIAATLKATYGQAAAPGEAAIFRSVSAMPWPRSKVRRFVAAIGRRGLKTSGLLSWAAVFEALNPEHDAHAARGSRVYCVVVAPYLQQARESVRGIKAVLDALASIGVRYSLRDASGAPELVITTPTFATERVITVMTADAVSVRGFAVAFAGYDECGFLPFEETHAVRDRDIVRALSPAMVQFPDALSCFVSSPGAPGSLFEGLVTKPPASTLVVRAPTWVTNPRVTEAMCWAEAGGDAATFEQEYRASRFGYHAETFIDASHVVVGSPYAGQGARPGSFAIGLDVAQLHDQTAIVVVSSFEVEINPAHPAVRHVVCEHVEAIESSKKSPTPIEAIASRVAQLSRSYGNAPVLHDPFMGPVVKNELAKVGFRPYEDPSGEKLPPPGTYCQRSMDPSRQTPRWRGLRELVHGGRLHVASDHAALVQQLAALRATQLSSGALKVEGRRDDLADALALAAQVASQLVPTGGPGGAVEYHVGGFNWDAESGTLSHDGIGWSRRMPNGSIMPAEHPRWAPGWEEWAQEMLASGHSTPSIEAWRREREQQGEQQQPERPINVPVEGGTFAERAARRVAKYGPGFGGW
jgi:hypothetical protein